MSSTVRAGQGMCLSSYCYLLQVLPSTCDECTYVHVIFDLFSCI